MIQPAVSNQSAENEEAITQMSHKPDERVPQLGFNLIEILGLGVCPCGINCPLQKYINNILEAESFNQNDESALNTNVEASNVDTSLLDVKLF